MTDRHQLDIDLSPEEALEALSRASEMWGARWERQHQGGRLELPVLAGLKHGLLIGRVDVEPIADGSKVVFQIDDARYHLHRSALAILVIGAAGGIAATLWPFFPALLGVAPLAVVVAIGAWILVASRLRTSTVDDFFELLAGDADDAA